MSLALRSPGSAVAALVLAASAGGCFIEVGAGATVPVAGRAEGVGALIMVAAGTRFEIAPVRIGVAGGASVTTAEAPGGGVLNVGPGNVLVEADVTVARRGDRLLRVSAAGQAVGFVNLYVDDELVPGESSAFSGLLGATAQWIVRDHEGYEEWAWSLRLAPQLIRAEHDLVGAMTLIGVQLAFRIETGVAAVWRGAGRALGEEDD